MKTFGFGWGATRTGKLLGIILAILWLAALSARAQIDLYGQPRFVILSTPAIFTNNSATTTFTNVPVDTRGYSGIAAAIFSSTNNVGTSGKVYAYLEGSNDGTNWFLMTNTSYCTATNYNHTNYANGGFVATNTYLVPGLIAPSSPATLGFAGNFLVPQPFTNTAVFCTNVAGGTFIIGFDIDDGPRYIHLGQVISGTAVSYISSALLVTRKDAGNYY